MGSRAHSCGQFQDVTLTRAHSALIYAGLFMHRQHLHQEQRHPLQQKQPTASAASTLLHVTLHMAPGLTREYFFTRC